MKDRNFAHHSSQQERLAVAWPVANMMKDCGYHCAAYGLIKAANCNYIVLPILKRIAVVWSIYHRQKCPWKYATRPSIQFAEAGRPELPAGVVQVGEPVVGRMSSRPSTLSFGVKK